MTSFKYGWRTNWIPNYSSPFFEGLGRGKEKVFLLSIMIVKSAWHIYNGCLLVLNFGKHAFLDSFIISIDSFELLFLILHLGSFLFSSIVNSLKVSFLSCLWSPGSINIQQNVYIMIIHYTSIIFLSSPIWIIN